VVGLGLTVRYSAVGVGVRIEDSTLGGLYTVVGDTFAVLHTLLPRDETHSLAFTVLGELEVAWRWR